MKYVFYLTPSTLNTRDCLAVQVYSKKKQTSCVSSSFHLLTNDSAGSQEVIVVGYIWSLSPRTRFQSLTIPVQLLYQTEISSTHKIKQLVLSSWHESVLQMKSIEQLIVKGVETWLNSSIYLLIVLSCAYANILVTPHWRTLSCPFLIKHWFSFQFENFEKLRGLLPA
jgi:hypothetical protein